MSAKNRSILLKLPGLSQIVPVLTILMEVFWSYACLVFISQMASRVWEGPPLNLISCVILALFTEVIVRLAMARKWSLKKIRWLVLSPVLLLLLVILRLNLSGGYSLQDTGWFSYAGANLSAILVGFFSEFIWPGGVSAPAARRKPSARFTRGF